MTSRRAKGGGCLSVEEGEEKIGEGSSHVAYAEKDPETGEYTVRLKPKNERPVRGPSGDEMVRAAYEKMSVENQKRFLKHTHFRFSSDTGNVKKYRTFRCHVALEDVINMKRRKADAHAEELAMNFPFDLAVEIVSFVEFMHSNKVFHNDIKPDNIVIGLSEKTPATVIGWMLIDFEMATDNNGLVRYGKSNFNCVRAHDAYSDKEVVTAMTGCRNPKVLERNAEGRLVPVVLDVKSAGGQYFAFAVTRDRHATAMTLWELGKSLKDKSLIGLAIAILKNIQNRPGSGTFLKGVLSEAGGTFAAGGKGAVSHTRASRSRR